MKLPGVFAVFVGVMMLAQWAFFLASRRVPELQSEPWRIALHRAAEFITAGGLILAGVGLLRRSSWAVKAYLFFAGMLCYSIIASPGYFAQQGQWPLVAMFAFLLVLLAATLITALREDRS